MKCDRLKPYVYKVEGAQNFALYDLLNGKFFQFSTNGTVEELRKILFENGLIFETHGVVPNKFYRDDLWEVQNKIAIRELQIRLNGYSEDNCWNRLKKDATFKKMEADTIDHLIQKFTYIPVDKLRIESKILDNEKLERIIKYFKCNKVELNITTEISPDIIDKYYTIANGKKITLSKPFGINELTEIKVEIFNFFYSKIYNPCLGHKIAIDTEGEIKPCLWFEEILGNVRKDNIKDMIICGSFDKYWNINKNDIETCKDCELRQSCNDCRVFAINRNGNFTAKPGYCTYNPYN